MKITRELLRKWGACYNDAKIATLVPETGLTPLEIAALDIPAEDRLWVLLREDIIPARELRLLACGWAEAVCLKTGWDNEHSLNAIAVARRFACGDAAAAEAAAVARAAWSVSQAAWAAVRSAESDRVEAAAAAAAEAATSAAWAAALSSSAAAATAAAEAAARSAAEAAGGGPDWAASAAAEAKAAEQLADVVNTLQE